VTSEARERALAEDDTVLATDADKWPDDQSGAVHTRAETDGTTEDTGPEPEDDDVAAAEAAPPAEGPETRRRGRRMRRAEAADEAPEPDEDDVDRGARSRPSLPLVPVLALLLVLLLGAMGWLWFTRPATSSVRTGDYVGVLQAARSEVVDLTSFDYLTLDDDIAEAKRITVGDLRKETIDRFNSSRQQLTDAQAVVNTEVVGAAVTRADATRGTVVLVIQSTQKTSADQQAQVVRYRVQAELTRSGDRWVLTGLAGR
jgi:Mce-associated membrane protein